MEKKAKKLVLAAAFASVFAASAIAPTSLWAQGNQPKNHRFVRAIPNNASIYQWSGSNAYAMSSQNTLPRDPAFGKGNADNDTFHLPSESDFR